MDPRVKPEDDVEFGVRFHQQLKRPAFTASRIHADLGPGRIRRLAAEFDAVVQAELAVVPELDADRANAETGPVGGARNIADSIFRGVFGNRLSSANRPSSGRDCFDAQAPMRLPRGREA